MRYSKAFLLTTLSSAVLAPLSDLRGADAEIKRIERSSISYRLENVKRGYVRIRISNEIHPVQRGEFLYEVFFDDNRTQQIRSCRLLGQATWGKPEKAVITPTSYIKDVEFIDTAVLVSQTKNNDNAQQRLAVINPRLLGMVRGGADLLHTLDIEDLLNRSNSNTTIQSVKLESDTAWRIDYHGTKEGGYGCSIWIIPEKGFSVARIELRMDQQGKRFMQTIDSHLKQYPLNGVWYPEHVIATDTLDGDLRLRQVVHVEDARFGESIDDSVFSLSGLNLEPGRQVVDASSGLPWAKVWNGTEAVESSGVRTAPVRVERRPLLLWSLAVGLALAGMFYFRRIIRQRGSSAGAAE
jgi:hypothetical protein